MANMYLRILAGNLNLGRSYLITTVKPDFFAGLFFLCYLTCKIHFPKIFQIVKKKIFAMFFKQLGTIWYKNLCQRVKRETFQSLKFWKIIRKMIMCLVRRKTCLFLRAIHTAKFGIQNYWEWLDHLQWKKRLKKVKR